MELSEIKLRKNRQGGLAVFMAKGIYIRCLELALGSVTTVTHTHEVALVNLIVGSPLL
jgi:hypothetical protein